MIPDPALGLNEMGAEEGEAKMGVFEVSGVVMTLRRIGLSSEESMSVPGTGPVTVILVFIGRGRG